jgi:hypothetical protein
MIKVQTEELASTTGGAEHARPAVSKVHANV